MQISLRLEVLKVFTLDFSLSSDKKEKKDEEHEVPVPASADQQQ